MTSDVEDIRIKVENLSGEIIPNTLHVKRNTVASKLWLPSGDGSFKEKKIPCATNKLNTDKITSTVGNESTGSMSIGRSTASGKVAVSTSNSSLGNDSASFFDADQRRCIDNEYEDYMPEEYVEG